KPEKRCHHSRLEPRPQLLLPPFHVKLEQGAHQNQGEDHESEENQDGERDKDKSLLGIAGAEESEVKRRLAPSQEKQRGDDYQLEDYQPLARGLLVHGERSRSGRQRFLTTCGARCEFPVAKRSLRQEFPKGALIATRRLLLAVAFAHLHQQGMKLVEEGLIGREMLVQELLHRGVAGSRGNELVASHDPAGVSVGDEEGLPASVEQDRVRGLWSWPLEVQQLLAQ